MRGHRESYDLAVSRAVAQLNVLCELALPLVKVGGQFLAMKSVGTEEEIATAKGAIRTLGGKIVKVEDYTIPDERGHAPRGGDREGLPYPAEVSEGVRKDQKAAAVSG